VIENIQDVFYRSDTKGNLIMAIPSWARMLGYDSLDDCIGYNIADKFYFEPQRRKEFLAAVYRDGSVRDYEVVLKHRDGRPIHVSCNGHLYYDDAGLLLGIEGIFQNISDRHIVNEMMIEKSPNPDIDKKIDGTIFPKTPGVQSQLYLSNALKMAQDSISILDLSGRCIWINDAFVTVISPRKDEMLIGKSFARFIAPEDRKNALDCMTDVRKSGNKRITLSLLSPSGRIPAEASVSSINDNEDGIIGYMTIIRQAEQDHGKLYSKNNSSEKHLQKKRRPKL
jgi:PAS domain S-box-containing protein